MKLTKSQMQAQFMDDMRTWMAGHSVDYTPALSVHDTGIVMEIARSRDCDTPIMAEYVTDHAHRTLRLIWGDKLHPHNECDWCEEDILHDV